MTGRRSDRDEDASEGGSLATCPRLLGGCDAGDGAVVATDAVLLCVRIVIALIAALAGAAVILSSLKREGALREPMPVFAIKAKDDLALDTVRHYAELCRSAGLAAHAVEVEKAVVE